MGAVDIGVGHDDDALVAQRFLAVLRADAAAERQHDVAQFLVGPHLVGRGAGDVEDLAAQRQDRLGFAVARLLRRAAGAVALDEEDFGARGGVAGAIGQVCRAGAICGSRSCATFPFAGAAAGVPRRARRCGRAGCGRSPDRRSANGRNDRGSRCRRDASLRPKPAAPWSAPGIAGCAETPTAARRRRPRHHRRSPARCAGCRRVRHRP